MTWRELLWIIPNEVLADISVESFNSYSEFVLNQRKPCGRGYYYGFPIATLHLHPEDGYWVLSGTITEDGAVFLSHFFPFFPPSEVVWLVSPITSNLAMMHPSNTRAQLMAFELEPARPPA